MSHLIDTEKLVPFDDYDRVILDLALPDSSEFNTFQRAKSWNSRTPIVIYAAAGGDINKRDIISAGFGFVPKNQEHGVKQLSDWLLHGLDRARISASVTQRMNTCFDTVRIL